MGKVFLFFLGGVVHSMEINETYYSAPAIKEIIEKDFYPTKISVHKIKNKIGTQSGDVFLIKDLLTQEPLYVWKNTGRFDEAERLLSLKSLKYLKNLETETFCITQCEAVYQTKNRYCLLLQAAKGRSLYDELVTLSVNQKQLSKRYEMIHQFGEGFGQFHKEISLNYWKENPWHLKKQGKTLEQMKDNFELKDVRSIIHGDMHADNILVEEKQKKRVFYWIDMGEKEQDLINLFPFSQVLSDVYRLFHKTDILHVYEASYFMKGLKKVWKDKSIGEDFGWLSKNSSVKD